MSMTVNSNSSGATTTDYNSSATKSADGSAPVQPSASDKASDKTVADANSPSSIVILSGVDPSQYQVGHTYQEPNRTIIMQDAMSLKHTSLSVSWSPELFVRSDENSDGKLTSDEFQKMMAHSQVDADSAKQLFDKFFTKSKDGSVSLDNFVEGVRNAYNQGDTSFVKLFDSYTRDADGTFNTDKLDAFLAPGLATAEKYWAQHRGD